MKGRRWKNRALIRERDAHRARRLWTALILIAVALAPAGFYLHEQNKCLELSYEIESIEQQRELLTEGERRLEVEGAEIGSMQSVERWAARKRLTRPELEEIVVVDPAAPDADTKLARVPDGLE